MPTTLATIGQFRTIPLGALLGISVAGAIIFGMPEASPGGWMEAPFVLFCAGCGVLLERLFRPTWGAMVESKFKHLAARYEARLEMQKLRRYEKEGVLNAVDARRIAARIAKRDVVGGPGPKGKPRGPYKKKLPPPPPPAPEEHQTESPGPETPPAAA